MQAVPIGVGGRADMEGFPVDLLPSSGAHNCCVLLAVTLLLGWAAEVLVRAVNVLDVYRKLRQHQLQNRNCLGLEGLGAYADELPMVTRRHFNQILRIRRAVPPAQVARIDLLASVVPESISFPGYPHAFGLQFTYISSVPATVRCFWGVPVEHLHSLFAVFADEHEEAGAVEESALATLRMSWWQSRRAPADAARRLLEMEDCAAGPQQTELSARTRRDFFPTDGYCFRSRELAVPPAAGEGTRFELPREDVANFAELQSDGEGGDTIFLVLVLSTDEQNGAPSQSLFTLVNMRNGEPKVVRQEVLVEGGPKSKRKFFEVNGMFGLEDLNDRDCMVCYERPKDVVLANCRHCSVCSTCLRSLRDDKCPLCRAPFTAYFVLPLLDEGDAPEELQMTPLEIAPSPAGGAPREPNSGVVDARAGGRRAAPPEERSQLLQSEE